MQVSIEKTRSILDHEYIEWGKYKYENSFINNRDYIIQTDRIKEQGLGGSSIDSVYFSWLLDLSILHFEYSTYAKVKLNNEVLAKEHLALSNEYGYNCLHYGNKSCGCFESKNPFIILNKATFMMSNLLLTNEIEKFNTVGQDLIASLNGEGCIIKKGYAKATISWLILKLYGNYSNTEITLHELLQPKDTYPYDEVLEIWDTDNINEVTKFIEILCDAHLSQAELDYTIHQEEAFNSLKYRELFIVGLYSLPFEVLTWLKLRELKGLENPKEFTHPLMSTNLTKMYLDIQAPLKTPNEVPYVNELLAKLKEQCPDYDKQKQKTTAIASKDKTPHPKQEVPKTGRYRATLPNNHPQAQQLESDPHSYARFEEGKLFSYEGLEDYEIDKIAWTFTGAN